MPPVTALPERTDPPAADTPLAVANLGVRFLLELAALGAFGYWGWTTQAGVWRVALVALLPLTVAALWGTFRVPDDGGDPLVAVPGALRLALEALVFGGATLALWAAGRPTLAAGFGLVVLAHNLLAWRRVRWLLSA